MDLSAAETLKKKGVSVLQPQGSPPPAADKRVQMDGAAAGPGAPRVPEELSILPVRGFVLFPGAVLPLTVSRPASIKLLDETLPITKVVGFLTQRDEQKEEPAPQDLYDVGTAAIVLKLLRQAEDQLVIVVQGLRRFAIRKIVATEPYLRAEIDLPQSIVPEQSSEWQAEFQNLRDSATRLAQLRPDVPEEAAAVIRNIDDPEQLADFLTPNLDIPVAQKQAILEELDVRKRLRAVQTHVSAQLEVAQIQQKLQEDVKSQFSDAQRKAYLRGQLKAIQRELGEGDTGADEQVARLRTRLEEAKPPAEVTAQAERELKRLDIIPPASPEYSVIVSYVETIAELPWLKLSEDNLDLDKAQEILDRDHYDLEKVKRRLIEYLAVLDPRQNNAFGDRYLDVPFDLSQIIFIATANYIGGIPGPLLDRMELIDLPGYTEREKLEIGKRYLLPRQLSENGLKPEQVSWDEEALRLIIADYTHEAGVRELERQIGAVCRTVAARVARGTTEHGEVTPAFVRETPGPARYVHEQRLTTNAPGVVTGLAYTPTGGELLHIEAARYPGKGNITLTGQIGNVMKESAQAALSLVRSRDGSIGINPEDFRKYDIHVHVPAGAVPKDGPSAGVAMFTALASLFTNTPVRSDVAMTGEITLRGLVLPIGGLKEKSLAAMRAGISTVLIPKLNEKDLVEIPEEAKQKLKFVPVETVDEVLANALERTSSDQHPS